MNSVLENNEQEILEQKINSFDLVDYLIDLQDHHEIFYLLLDFTKPIFTNQIDRIAMIYNNDLAKIELQINPAFFFRLSHQERLFVLCHEAMHLLFAHTQRAKMAKMIPEYAELAADIVINESLVREFGFRKELKLLESLPFINTVFKEEDIRKYNIKYGMTMENYYNLLDKTKVEPKTCPKPLEDNVQNSGNKQDSGNKLGKPNDQPSSSPTYGENPTEIPAEVLDDINRQVGNQLNKQKKEELEQKLEGIVGRGTIPLGNSFSVTLNNAKSTTWEEVVKDKIKSLLRVDFIYEDIFQERHRRVVNLPEDMFIPVEKMIEKPIFDKFNLKFFFDCSGSCINYKQKFFDLLRSIPREKFNIDAYSFDTRVYKIDIDKPRVSGGGGTSFNILENRVQACMKDKDDPSFGRYPDLVFVITDGAGNPVNPAVPENWYWIMTDSYYVDYYIPRSSHKIPIKNIKYEKDSK